MQEKQAIITLNYGYETNAWYKYMREVFIPSIRDYARRIQVDFILMNNNNNKYFDTWNQLQFMDYLDYYDRVMYIDGDCYIPKLFRYNFFNISSDKIGLYKKQFPETYQCDMVFVIMLVHAQYKLCFIPPIYDEQKYKYEKFSNIPCIMGKYRKDDNCRVREECYINECVNKHNLKANIYYLTHLKTAPHNYWLNKKMIHDESNIYHIQLNVQIDEIAHLDKLLLKNK